jgi:hypothetical protein
MCYAGPPSRSPSVSPGWTNFEQYAWFSFVGAVAATVAVYLL